MRVSAVAGLLVLLLALTGCGFGSVKVIVEMPQQEVDAFAAGLDFDTINFSNRSTDLLSYYDVLTYTATKRATLTVDQYEVRIRPVYDRQQGAWTLSQENVTETQTGRNWNINGNWRGTGDGAGLMRSNDLPHVNLSITIISESEAQVVGWLNNFGWDNIDIKIDGVYTFSETENNLSLTIPLEPFLANLMNWADSFGLDFYTSGGGVFRLNGEAVFGGAVELSSFNIYRS